MWDLNTSTFILGIVVVMAFISTIVAAKNFK